MLKLRPLEHLANFTLRAVLDRHPAIFDRLGSYTQCRYLIDVTDSPFMLLLLPQERLVEVHLRSESVLADAAIRGRFGVLSSLAQGKGDGDAVFFSRALAIEGDTEAVLALRNALDDADVDIIQDSLESMGFLGSPLRMLYRTVKEMRPVVSGMFAP